MYPEKLDRRAFLSSSMAGAGLAAFSRPLSLLAQMGAVSSGMGKPSLAGTFSPLAGSLVPADRWSFYPTIGGRQFWTDLPADVQHNLSARALTANTGDWPQLTATLELEFKRNGNRSRFEALHFGRRTRLIDLVFGECVENSGRYLDEIANGIWLVCEESFWGAQAHLGAQKAGVGLGDTAEPIIDLFAAETSATLALIVHLLGDRLDSVSPLLIPRIVREAERRVLSPFLDRNDFSWMGLTGKPHHLNNWNSWINANVLTTTLFLESDPARRAATVLKVCRSVDEYLADYSPDGACEEGPAYWTRSAGTFFDGCQMLISAHGGKGSGVLTHPFTRAMGRFIMDAHIAGDMYCNYGDAHLQADPPAELVYRYGHDCGEAKLEAFGGWLSAGNGMAATGEALRSAMGRNAGGVASLTLALNALVVAKAIRTAPRHDALERTAWYPDLPLMTARQKEGSVEGFYLAMQAAGNARSHGHNDSGSILVFHNGEPLMVDAGVGTYEAKTFSKDRYTIWSMQSQFHNLPMVDGIGEHEGKHASSNGTQIDYKASEVRYRDTDASTSMSANLAPAYPPEAGVTRWIRTATLDRRAGIVQLEEAFELDKPRNVTLAFLVPKEPVLAGSTMRIANAELRWDPAQLKAASERIELTDPTFQHAWGKALYRILLTTPKPVSSGSLRIQVHSA